MVAFKDTTSCPGCGTYYETSGTRAPHVCRGTGRTTYVQIFEERCPDLSKCNRHDRRTMIVLARKYGWKLPAVDKPA